MSVDAESGIVERDIELLSRLRKGDPSSRAHLHVAHLSTAKALEAVRRAKRSGSACHLRSGAASFRFNASGDRRLQHRCENESATAQRRRSHRADQPASSTERWTPSPPTTLRMHCMKKNRNLSAPRTALSDWRQRWACRLLVLHRQHRMPLMRVLALLSSQPAQVLHLKDRGSLAVGSFADIVIFRPNDDWQFHVSESKSKSRNSPFDGSKLPGRIQMTISEGHIVHDIRSEKSASASR